MDYTNEWLAAYGPMEGAWLLDELHRVTKEAKHIEHIRIARQDSEEESARYRDAIRQTTGAINGDWYLTSPTTGLRYRMGCDWHE